MKKIYTILFLITHSFIVSSQEYNYLNTKVSLFDKTSIFSFFKIDSSKFSFLYSEKNQRFYIDFDSNLKPSKYYKIHFNNLKYEGKEKPILFIRFEKKGNKVYQIFNHLHSRFHVFKTPPDFDKVRLILQYKSSCLSFDSFIIKDYKNNENSIKADINDLVSLIYGDDFSYYNKDLFLKSIFDSLFVCKWDLGNYYNKSFWVGDNHTRTQERWIYGFFWLQDLVLEYKNTGNILYLEKAKEIYNLYKQHTSICYSKFNLKGKTLCFGNDSLEGAINKPMIWHDETVARRLFASLLFFEYIDFLNDTILKKSLDNDIKQMASILASVDFYSQDNNHGMFQSLSLLAYSCYYNDSLDVVYQDLSLSRLFDYFIYSFTDEGITREHTPTYHFTISNRLHSFIKFYDKYLSSHYEKIINDELNQIFHKSKIFSYAILLPDNSFPPIGDCVSGRNPQFLYPNIFDLDTINLANNRNYIFNSGYAIFKEIINSSTNFYLMFLAAYNHWSHKHSDDLSFILYYNNRYIFIDCGYFGYEKNSQLVDYGNSSFAHNTLIVDDNNLAKKENQDKNYTFVGFQKYSIAKQRQFVQGFNKRWPNAEHYRSITRENKIITITDSIISKDSSQHKYTLLFHCGNSIIPFYDGKKVTLYSGNEIIGYMKFRTHNNSKINIYYGNKNQKNNYIGIHCEDETTFSPVSHYVISLDCTDFNMNLETKIILK